MVDWNEAREEEMLAGLTNGAGGEPEAVLDERNDRLASTLVRRLCNQHGCPGAGCTSRNHRRDVAFMTEMLETLGLSGMLAEAADYGAPTAYHSVSRHDAMLWRKE